MNFYYDIKTCFAIVKSESKPKNGLESDPEATVQPLLIRNIR